MIATIAVVEDDVSVLDAIKMVLESAGWTVRAYTNGEAFLADSRRIGLPQCLIMEPHLPGIDGAEIAQAVINAGADLPIIVLTARPTSTVTRKMIDAGAHAVLTKPVAAEEIIHHVQCAIELCESEV